MAPARNFDVVTLNTWKASGHYARRVVLMSEGLAAIAPDIVLLQEVIVAPAMDVDTGAALARRLGLYHLHHPARAKRRVVLGHRVYSTSGLSVLSRLPIVRARVLSLPGEAEDGERLAQFVTVAGDGVELTVVNLHLSHRNDAESLRQRQLDAIVRVLAGWPGGEPAIIGGDFNCEPQSPPLCWLTASAGVVTSGVWEAVGGPQPTLTTADGRHPGRRCVDHLFVLSRRQEKTPRWTSGARVLDRLDAESDAFASDHFGVYGRVALPAHPRSR
jgi:endonuclease/exonuclease/phosphatase family metal-dependent hydrolase